MRRYILLIFFSNSLVWSAAQQRTAYWNIGVNPFGWAEFLSTIGPSAEYRISQGVGFWAEGTYTFNNLYKLADWKKVRGYRFLFQPRFYLGKERLRFIAPELRIKRFNYSVGLDFVNEQTQDTLSDYVHRATQLQVGGGLVIGIRKWLSRPHNLLLELTGGLGGKIRHITRRNIPAGYTLNKIWGGFGLAPHFEWDKDVALYLPMGIRLIWKLDRFVDK